ncbi:MAG: outer membrane beta-barrel protein [Flavobacteriales bacterium]|nr:outer membrane beta-barrel protein [Flavobacteriales bacterium]
MSVLRPLLALCALFLFVPLYAQRPNGAGGQGRPAIARVYGKVLDAGTRKPVEFAPVQLLRAGSDSVLSGALTEENGDFQLDKLPFGPFKLRVSFMGYKRLELDVRITPDKVEQDLGNLLLEPDAAVLKDAEVFGEKSQAVLLVDRRVYNVEKDLSVKGGTGTDVMKNVPGLSVDADGNVTMRNSAPQVMVDGRPTVLSLDQIPADEIERVEVITNPGVAFDAGSGGGILNVVLKKSTRPGYSGQLQAGAGTNNRYQTNGNLNVKEGRWTFQLSGNYNFSGNNTTSLTKRDQLSNGVVVGTFDQEGNSGSDRDNYGGRFGVDWKASNRSTLSVSQSVRGRAYLNNDKLSYTETGADGAITSTGLQVNDQDNSGNELTSQVSFRHRTPKEGREWSTDLTYNRSRRSSYSTFTTNSNDPDGLPALGSPRVQENTGSTDADQFTWQFDMQDPRGENDKFEYGLRSNLRLDRSILDVVVGTDTSAAERDPTLSNDYDITDMVNAAYFNWIHRINETWGFQAGLRFEHSRFVSDIVDKDISFSYEYPDNGEDLARAIFPALYVSRKWKDSTRELQFNVSRKLNRPNFFQLMPVIMFSDSRNLRVGNPSLAPEFITLAEVNHLLPLGKGRSNWLSSLYMRNTDNVITSYVYPLPDDPEILVSSFINGDDSWTYGWENTVRLEPAKAVQVTLGATLQYIEIFTGQGLANNSGWQVNGKVNATGRLPKDWSVQLNGEYEGKRPTPQGYAIGNWGIDLSGTKEFNKHWSATLMVNDVFFTRKWGTVLDTPTLYQESERRREMRFVRLTLTWKFGEQDSSFFRRRNQQQRRDPGAGGEGGEGF